jgi:AraC family transcriptional regulator, positive regulator of tynA and feaB
VVGEGVGGMNGSWSTHAADARAPGDIWRDAVGPAGGGIETRLPSERFRGSFATRSLAGFKLVRFRSAGHAIARRGSGGLGSPGFFLVSLQMDGGARLIQDRREVEIGAGAGAIGLVDVARPFELSFPTEVERVFLFVPHDAVRARAPWLERADPASLGRDNPAARIMAEYMRLLGDPEARLDDRAALALLDGFMGTLAVASAHQCARRAGRGGPDLRFEALKAYMRCRLGDAALSPASVARAFGLSSRTVHKLFERAETTFSQWLLSQRLDACAAALEAAMPDVRIADAAFAAGFGDISHFNRRFKARFGMTPRQWRRRGPAG